MEVDIYQINSNSAAPAANFTRCTLLESNRQGSPSLPPPAPSVPLMPYERPIRRTLHDPAVPSVKLDADDRSKLHADAAPSALAKSKRSMKKKDRLRNTRRQHSNPNVINASAGREPTRFGRHLQKLKLQALPPCSDHNDDATTAAQYHRRRRRRASRSINPNPSGDHEDDRHEHEREPRLIEPDISPTSEPDICTTLDGQIQAVQHTPDPESITLHRPTYKPGDPFDPKAPQADPPQPGPSNLPTRLPEQIHHTVPFDDNELDKACEPGEPFDPKAPRAEPLQPSPSNLPAGPSEQIDAHAPSPTTINASFNQVRDLQHYKGVNIATMYPPQQKGYSASTSCSALPSLRPSFQIEPPSLSIFNGCIDAQTTGEPQPTSDKCTYTCRIPHTWRNMPQHTYDQLIRATATLLILWSQFWKWRRIKKKACYLTRESTNFLNDTQHHGRTNLAKKKTHVTSSEMKKADKPSGMGIYTPCSQHILAKKKTHVTSSEMKKADKPSGMGIFSVLPNAPASTHALHFPPLGVFLRMRSF
ncbi:hypothetical protein THAOC_16629 [Thalassiosira oceanica]|uniref:Uncharacterized protein n=1 Tax=Thalassiosira oceanica TaxID=159749 RepID=K0SBS2_THAOC|nr:hypothetical protein THAOC_16629 [Thalassiosira oceanica]|eukprot:EJK62745.1 hypothetical protein THAOC_16629 [Thalassiosira oceanica]